MNRTLSLPESTYFWLQAEAKKRGLGSVEELLEAWQAENDELRQRHEVVERVKALSDRLDAKYGEQPDSVDLIREDRDR